MSNTIAINLQTWHAFLSNFLLSVINKVKLSVVRTGRLQPTGNIPDTHSC
jgi:hypothetical protein